MTLEKNILLLICLLLTAISTGCSEPNEVEKPQSITLSVDKNNFKSNGNESVSFIVFANGKDITSSCKIIFKEDNTPLSGNTFSTNIPGTYTFYATFEGLSSSDVQVNAMPIVLILEADTSSIITNGKSVVTFSATADGENVTGNIEVFYKSGETETHIEGNTFTTDQEGSYEFYCKYNEQTSNTIIISAIPFTLSLNADKTSIKANGREFVNFTVTANNEDVTSEAIIYYKDGEDLIQLENNTFATIMEGEYEFFAQYQKQTSGNVSIEAIISRLTLSTDKSTTKTGENISFSAISDDIDDVSTGITLHITCGENKETIEGKIFTPQIFGTYFIYASYEGRISNTIEVDIYPAIVSLSADKANIKSTGVDYVTFTVVADGKQVNDADIFLKGEQNDVKITDNKFSSNNQGTFSFYAQFKNTKSELIGINVLFAKFFKQSCAMSAVATWCGYSPQMINAFHDVHRLYSEQINIVSIHRSTSDLGSSDINCEEFIEHFYGATPFGIIDFEEKLSRDAEAIRQSHYYMKFMHPVTSGIAITSNKDDKNINITLNIKVSEANEYSVCAIIVEDNIKKEQVIYLNNSQNNAIHDRDFIHHGVATYIMPNTNPITGKSLGTLQPGSEVSETFSIPLNKIISRYRTVNLSNCRVVAYVMKREYDNLYINNSTSCPINGSVDYKYEE